MKIDQSTLTFILGFVALFSVAFNVYARFRNPQIAADTAVAKLRDDFDGLNRIVSEIKETHLRSVEKDIKDLTAAVNDLSKTVVRLSTIIDERIPKGSPNLTPPGL